MEDLFTAVLSPSTSQPQMPQQIQGAQSLHGHPGLHPSQPNSGLLGALDKCYGYDKVELCIEHSSKAII